MTSLYTLDHGYDGLPEGSRPVLVHALDGFVDAGAGVRLAAEHLLATLPHRLVARFDMDELHDYRARRPTLVFDTDHYEQYSPPRLELHEVTDASGEVFLLLVGSEPDLRWEGVAAAVRELVTRLGVRLTVGWLAIPMAVPHTRPLGATPHATRADLVPVSNRGGGQVFEGQMTVPGTLSALIELRLGEAQHDAVGFAVHVPHYLARAEFPPAALELLARTTAATGLELPTAALVSAGEDVMRDISAQVDGSAEVKAVVHALEEQYDAYAGATERGSLLAGSRELPTGEELAGELERFLADLGGSDGSGPDGSGPDGSDPDGSGPRGLGG